MIALSLAILVTAPAERAYLRTATPLTAADVTANLPGMVGKRVAFVCSIVTVVDRETIVGQCGKKNEPVDLYVRMPSRGIRTGDRVRVVGEMDTPSMWVDINAHTWYTGFVKAVFVDRLR